MTSSLTPELRAILEEANSRGCLVTGVKPAVVESTVPQIVAVRPFHAATAKASDWRKQKAPEPTGYGSPVDDPEWNARIAFKP